MGENGWDFEISGLLSTWWMWPDKIGWVGRYAYSRRI